MVIRKTPCFSFRTFSTWINKNPSWAILFKQWEKLPQHLVASGFQLNWCHLFLTSSVIPNTQTAIDWLRRFHGIQNSRHMPYWISIWTESCGRVPSGLICAVSFYLRHLRNKSHDLDKVCYSWLWPVFQKDWEDPGWALFRFRTYSGLTCSIRCLDRYQASDWGCIWWKTKAGSVSFCTWRKHGHGTVGFLTQQYATGICAISIPLHISLLLTCLSLTWWLRTESMPGKCYKILLPDGALCFGRSITLPVSCQTETCSFEKRSNGIDRL